MALKVIPARLQVIMARQAKKAVIIRRGPSRWTRLSLWHTDTDQVEHGQWLHARLYPERCDLSPDGDLFIYFCYHDGGHHARQKEGYSYAYTAISHPPYFTALALWNAFDTWGGGGKFVDNRQVYVSAGPETHPNHPLANAMKRVDAVTLNRNDESARFVGAGRDWQPVDMTLTPNKLMTLWQRGNPYLFYRDSPNGNHRLERTWYIGYAEKQRRYSLYTVQPNGGDPVLIEGDLTWADWDQRGRLCIADRGALYVVDPDAPKSCKLESYEATPSYER